MKIKILTAGLTCLLLASCTTIGPKNMYTTDFSTGDVVVPVRYVGGVDTLNKKVNGNLFITNSSTKFISGMGTVHFSFPTGSISGIYVGNEVQLHFGKTLARWLFIGPFALFIKDKSEVLAIEFTEKENNSVFNPIFQIKVDTGARLRNLIQVKQRFAAIKMHWETAISADTVSAYEAYLKQHADSENADEARSRLTKLNVERDWKNAQASDSIPAYEEFLKQHADSENADEARSRLKTMNKELLEWEQAQRNDTVQGYSRFIAQNPRGRYVENAKAKISEHEAGKAKGALAGPIKKEVVTAKAQPLARDVRTTKFKSSMPTPRMAVGSASVKDRIYVFGGVTNQGRSTSLVEEYDPLTDKWAQKASMPTSRATASAVALGKTVYVVGGRNENGIATAVEVYDTENNSWKKAKPLPVAKWNHMITAFGGKIYLIGGITGVGNNRKCIGALDIYDPTTDSWTAGRPLPEPKQGSSVAEVNGKIYIMGGRTGAGDSGQATSSVAVYDPLKNAWSSAKSMQAARTGAPSVVVDDKIYVVGGAAGDKATTSITVYDPAADKWTTGFSLQEPRSGHSAASIGNNIYIIGGATASSLSAITGTVEELILTEVTSTSSSIEKTAGAAGQVKGKFVDGNSGKPMEMIPGLFFEYQGTETEADKAEIHKRLQKVETETDKSGAFLLKNVPSGKYALFTKKHGVLTTFTSAPGQSVDLGTIEVKEKEAQGIGSPGEAPPAVVILQDHPTANHIAKVIPYGREKLLTLSEPKVEGNIIKVSYKWEKENAEELNLKGIAYIRGANLVPGASVILHLHKGWNYDFSKNEMWLTISHDLHGTARIAIFFGIEADMDPQDINRVVTYKAVSNVVFVDFVF